MLHNASLAGGPIYRLIYFSVNMMPFGDPVAIGMPGLVNAARARNAACGITGVLYSDGAYFSQLLEGPQAAVETVFASICRDPRHQAVRVTFEGWHHTRFFIRAPMHMVCDERARRAIGPNAHDLCARLNPPDTFVALMDYIIIKIPAGWSAPVEQLGPV